MLLAAVRKDAVTTYKVYAENSLHEVLKSQRLKFVPKDPDRGRNWGRLISLFKSGLQVDICPPAVREIRELRHILTHNRGKCRIDNQRLRFGTKYENDDLPSRWVELTREKTEEMCNTLAEIVHTIDPKVWQYSYGRDRLDFS